MKKRIWGGLGAGVAVAIAIAIGLSPSSSAPLFQFAPASGTGMGTACAGTTPTGSKGEALTFSRASVATCLKGNTTTGIANGDLVKLTSGQPAVMPGGDGTGALGLLVEEAGTNLLLRSEELNNIAWSTEAAGTSITVTPDYAVGPDGTIDAERVQFGAVTAAQNSGIYQGAGTFGTANTAVTIFAKGTSGSGSIDVATFNTATWACGTCSFTSTTWTRCEYDRAASASYVEYGNLGVKCGGSRSAQDVLLIATDSKSGTFATSYVPTAGASVARSAVVAYAAVTVPAAAAFSMAADVVLPPSLSSNVFLHAYKDASNSVKASVASGKLRCTFVIGGATTTQDSAGSLTVSADNRIACYGDGTNVGACIGGVCTTGAAALTPFSGAESLYLGSDQGGANQLNGVIKQVCQDTTASKCR